MAASHEKRGIIARKFQRIVSSGVIASKNLLHFSKTSRAPQNFARGYLLLTIFMVIILFILLFLTKLRTEGYELGYRINTLEQEKQKLEEELRDLRVKKNRLRSYSSLIQLNEAQGLYLLPPAKWLEFE